MADGDSATDAADGASSNPPYDRWTLRDPSTVPYGYFSGSNNRCNETFWTSSSSTPPSPPPPSSSSSGGKTKGFYVTTAINYTNGPAHMGHAYEGTTADVIARFNTRSRVQLFLADEKLADRRIGGTFALDEAEAFVRLLERDGEIIGERRGETEVHLRRAR
jgi:hypothetical protein